MMYPYYNTASHILYILIGLISAYFINISVNYKSNQFYHRQTGYILFYFIFVGLASFRLVTNGIVGTDASGYEDFFLNSFTQTSRFEEQDILFGLFNKAVRLFIKSPVIYRFICYSIITLAYIFFIKSFCIKGVSCIPFIVLMIPFLKSFNTMRSSMAIAVILYGLIFLKDRRTFWGVILICISVFIHRMSILYVMFLPFYAIFRHYKYTNSNIKLIVIVSTLTIIGYYLALQVQQYAIALSLLDGTDAYYISKNLNGSILDAAVTVIPLVLLSVMWLLCNKRLKYDKNISFLELMVSFDIIITPIANILGMWRANEYFYLGRLVFWSYLIPVFCSSFKIQSRVFIKITFAILFTAWLTYRISREWEPCGLMPYKLFFL